MNITLNDLLFAFSRALDFVEKDLLGITTNHGKRVANMSMRLCRAIGMTESEIFDMASCAILHDNALTAYMLQFGEKNYARLEGIKIHCEIGEKNVKGFPFLTDTTDVILYHHENWDGSGFYGLQKEAIPQRSAILRIADNIDLQLNLGKSHTSIVNDVHAHTIAHRGTLYAPSIVEAFNDTFTKQCIDEMSDDHIDICIAHSLPQVGHRLSTQELLDVCQMFAKIIDAKSHFTHNHSQGTARIAAHMGQYYKFDKQHCQKLEIAGFLHDIGKLAVPISILEKAGSLTPEEQAIIAKHSNLTLEILEDIAGLEDIALWAGNHHERLDGSGYGKNLHGDKLDFETRLIACCDIYQALTEERPYRKASNHKEAIAILRDMVKQKLIDGGIVEDMNIHLKNFTLPSSSLPHDIIRYT